MDANQLPAKDDLLPKGWLGRKVLILSPTGAFGGAERALVSLARILKEEGANPRAILLQNGPLEEILLRVGCPVEVVPSKRTRNLLRTGKVLLRLVIETRRSDVVVSNMSKGHIYGGLAARWTRVPEVWWQHGIPAADRIDAVAAKIPSSAVVCTTTIAMKAQRRLTPKLRLDLIPCGIDLPAVRAAAGEGEKIRRSLSWDYCVIVGIVGRLQPWKGQTTFLRAAAEVAAKTDRVRFCIVGGAVLGWEGEYPNQLRSLADDLGIAEICHFAGHQEEVYPWFDAMDIVVNASESEPFGLVILEAMALGKPVVATAEGGPTEIIRNGVDGFLVSAGDSTALATRLLDLANNEELRARIGSGAEAAVKRFTDKAMVGGFTQLFEELNERAVD